MDRARGVKLNVMDLSSLEAQALTYRQRTNPDCYEAKVYASPWAWHKSDNGHLYAICHEGVGYTVSKEEPLELSFHGTYHVRDAETGEITPNTHTFDVMPFGSIELYPDELYEFPVIGEVDLADHVRTFGSRLEQNFHLWYNKLV